MKIFTLGSVKTFAFGSVLLGIVLLWCSFLYCSVAAIVRMLKVILSSFLLCLVSLGVASAGAMLTHYQSTETVEYMTLSHPHSSSDANGFVTGTNNFSYGQNIFQGNEDMLSNYCEYRLTVPENLDTTETLMLMDMKFRVASTETAGATQSYKITMCSTADAANYTGTLINGVVFGWTCDNPSTYAEGDVASVSDITLTNWAGSLTPGHMWIIRLARDGDAAGDSSTINTYSGPLIIRYGKN